MGNGVRVGIGCTPIATRLHENVDDVAFLIDSALEIPPLALDRHEELVQMTGVA